MTTDTAPTAGRTEVDPAAGDVVEALLARDTFVFGSFHRGRLLGFATHLLGTLRQYAGQLDVDVTATLDAAVSDLMAELSQLAGRALVERFHDFRTAAGLPPEAASSTAFELFSSRLDDPVFVAELERPYPVLTRLLDTAVADRLRLLGEVLAAASADRGALEALGLAPDGPLTAISVSSGDAHNGGRRVAVWRTAAGALVHKPRTLELDDALASAAELLTPHLEDGCALRLPRMLSRAGHGWQEHVSAASMTTLDEVRRHRYRMGAFLALFASLGSTDLHHENVIAAGEHPMFVDLETVLQHLPEPGPDGPDGPVGSLSSPLLATMLLPLRVAGTPLDVDMSGIGTVSAQTSHLLSYSMLDRATDAMRFERTSFEVRHGDNLARLGGVALPATSGEEDLVLGFTDALAGIRAERDRLLQVFACPALSVRQVVRPTNVYARFLAASTHPRYLSDPAERTRLLSSMAAVTTVAEPARQAFAALELAALERHDVPWFAIEVDGVALRAPLDGSTPPAYSRPLSERVRASLDDVLDTPPARHEHTIRMCLATSTADLPLSPLDARPAPGSYAAEVFAADAGPVAAGVTRLLVDTAHHVSADATGLDHALGGGRQPGRSRPGAPARRRRDVRGRWHPAAPRGPLPGDRRRRPGPPGPPGDPAGPCPARARPAARSLLLRRPDRQRGPRPRGRRARRRRHRARAARRPAHRPAADHRDRRARGRPGRRALRLRRLGRRPRARGPAPRPDGVPHRRGRRHAPGPEHPGPPVRRARPRRPRCGLVPGPVRRPPRRRRRAPPGRGGPLPPRLRPRARPGAGPSTATPCRSGRSQRPEVAHAGWCKGTAGSLVALAEGLPLTGWMPTEVDRVVDLLVDRGTPQAAGSGRDLSPCHGVSGWVQALLRTGRLRERPALVDRARRTFAERRALVARTGYTGGLSGSAGFLGYMLGLTGVAHTEILLDHPGWGSPLTLTATLPAAAPEEDH